MRVMITTLDLVNPRRSHHGVASIIRHGHQMKNRVEIELPQKSVHGDNTLFDRATMHLSCAVLAMRNESQYKN